MNATELVDYISIILKIIVGISILNVWLIRPTKATKWRGGAAKTILEEFIVYGLSKQFCYFIGLLKVTLAIILLASIQFEALTLTGSIGLAVLLLGSISMHLKVGDKFIKSFPALLFLVLNLVITLISII